ncbi:MAG: hypothetical protein IPJ34_26425 [Myxococcales bacterium]|nr:hypothetical protein [Myxococcales bacterium]
MKIAEAVDFVQMRDGTSFVGAVTTPTFDMVIAGGTHLTLKRENLISIEMRSRTGLPKDRVHTKDGSQIFGDLVTKTLDLKSDETGSIQLAVADVLVVQLTFG